MRGLELRSFVSPGLRVLRSHGSLLPGSARTSTRNDAQMSMRAWSLALLLLHGAFFQSGTCLGKPDIRLAHM